MANTRFKTENSLLVTGESNTIINTGTLFNNTVTVNSATVIVNGALVVGNSATGQASDLTVTGNLLITGNLVYTNTSTSSDLRAASDGLALGNTSNRFDGYLRNTIVYGYITPASNTVGIALGNNESRWVITANSLSLSSQATLDGNLAVGTNLFRVSPSSNQVSINSASYSGVLNVVGGTNFTGTVNVTANVSSNSYVVGNIAFIATNSATVSTTNQIVVDKFANNVFKAVKYFVYVTDSNSVKHALEIVGLNAGADILQSQYGEVFNTSLGTFTLTKNTNNTDVDLMFTAAGANATNSYTVSVYRNIIF